MLYRAVFARHRFLIGALAAAALLTTAISAWANPAELQSPGSATGPYRGFGFEWENNTLGMERTVPKPFTPVVADGRALNVWGRSFRFSDALLPEQIVSQEQELLASPMRLRLSIGGQAVDDRQAGTRITDQEHPDRAELTGRLVAPGAVVRAETALEFDGFLRVDVTIEPTGEPVTIDSLTLEIPFRRRIAKFYHRHIEYDYVAQRFASRLDLADTAARIGDEPVTMGFNHYVWVGDERVGAELSMETNYYWSPAVNPRGIALEPQGDTVTMRVRCIEEALRLAEPVTFSFGLYVNPVKPMRPNWRTVIVSNTTSIPNGYDPEKWRFVTGRPGPRHIIPLEHAGLPFPPKDPELRAQYDRVRQTLDENGVGFIPYGCLFERFVNEDELQKYANYWLRDLSANGGQPGAYMRLKNRTLGDRTGAAFGISLYPKSIQDFLVWSYKYAAETLKDSGLYFDVSASVGNVVNPNTGAIPLTADDVAQGRLYHPVFSAREFHKRLYRATKSVNPDFIINQHASKMPLLNSGFSDIIFTGEGQNALFRTVGRQMERAGTLPDADHPPYWPDHSLFSDEFFEAIYHQSTGYAHHFFPNVIKWNVERMRTHPHELAQWTRNAMARMVVRDIVFWRARIDYGIYDGLMIGIQNHFGGFHDPLRFVGPWEAERIRTDAATAKLRVGAYVRPGQPQVLLIVANWSDAPIRERIPLNFEGLDAGIRTITRIADIEGQHRFEQFGAPGAAQGVVVEVPANDFRAILIE